VGLTFTASGRGLHTSTRHLQETFPWRLPSSISTSANARILLHLFPFINLSFIQLWKQHANVPKKRMAIAMSDPAATNNAKSQKLGSTSSNEPAPNHSGATTVAVASGASAQPGPPATSSHTPPAVTAPHFLCDDDMVKHVLASNLVQLKTLAADLQVVGGDSMPAHLLKAAIVRVCFLPDATISARAHDACSGYHWSQFFYSWRYVLLYRQRIATPPRHARPNRP